MHRGRIQSDLARLCNASSEGAVVRKSRFQGGGEVFPEFIYTLGRLQWAFKMVSAEPGIISVDLFDAELSHNPTQFGKRFLCLCAECNLFRLGLGMNVYV